MALFQTLFLATLRSFVIGGVLLAAAFPSASRTRPVAEQTSVHRALLTTSVFEEPLVPTGTTLQKEDESLFQAIQAYEKQARVDNFRAFDAFLSDYPRSLPGESRCSPISVCLITTMDIFPRRSMRGKTPGTQDGL